MPHTTNSVEARTRLMTMLRLQDGINSKINADWMEAGNPWYRAIWTECSEMMDHVGWKWWKRNQPNVEQIHLELVDIFHFGLSELIVTNGTIDAALDAALAAYVAIEKTNGEGETDPARVICLIENFASVTLNSKSFAADSFADLCASVCLGGDQLYRKYVGKNVLNTFRQDHGYKDGTYVKIWGGREDNEWLAEIGATMQTSSSTFPTELYKNLLKAYESHGNAQAK